MRPGTDLEAAEDDAAAGGGLANRPLGQSLEADEGRAAQSVPDARILV
jgi:hypothetical protein